MEKRKVYLIVDKDKAERLVKCFPELKRRTAYNLAFEKGIEVLLQQKEEQNGKGQTGKK